MIIIMNITTSATATATFTTSATMLFYHGCGICYRASEAEIMSPILSLEQRCVTWYGEGYTRRGPARCLAPVVCAETRATWTVCLC